MFFAVLAAVLAQVTSIVAHGGVTAIGINGTKYTGLVVWCHAWTFLNFYRWSPYNGATGQTTAMRPYSSYDPIMTASAAYAYPSFVNFHLAWWLINSSMHCNNNGGSVGIIIRLCNHPLTSYYRERTNKPSPLPLVPVLPVRFSRFNYVICAHKITAYYNQWTHVRDDSMVYSWKLTIKS